MKLRGLLDRAIGNSICIRGYADIKDIARCSKSNESYQRQIIPEHKEDIAAYLDRAKYKFFPEVILSYTLDDENDNVELQPSITDIITTGSAQGKLIKFSVTKNEWAGKDSRTPDRIFTATIDIDEQLLKGNKPFHRIDGNHRLSAVDAMDDYYGKLKIPFCIILLRNDKEDEKFESVIFHNINSKGKQLTSEENLVGILENFSEEELNESFDWTYAKAKSFEPHLDFEYLSSLKSPFKLQEKTVLVEALEYLKKNELIKKTVTRKTFKAHLNKVNAIYASNEHLQASNNPDLFIAFLYYSFKGENDANLTAFTNWVIHNRTYELDKVDKDSLIKIFNKILDSRIRIFMAMPYYSDKEVDNYNRILREAVDEIKAQNSHLLIDPYPIMREEGASMDIVSNILNNITNCEIFIVDISENNPNVFFEYGYAKSLNKPIILAKKESDKKHKVPFDVEHNLRFKYAGDNDLKDLMIERIKQILVQLKYVVNK